MRTLLISPMWLDAKDGMKRHEKWLEFILPLKDRLGFEQIYFIDNASSEDKLQYLHKKYGFLYHRCAIHLHRKSHLEYPYWYSALAIGARYAIDNGYDKIIHIDTDMYPLSERICQYVKDLQNGWTAFWCPKYEFPETTFQIIGKDSLQDFYNHMSRDFLQYYPAVAEKYIPFTRVERGYIGDRYGEIGNGIPQSPEMDFYGQCKEETEMRFNVD